ncbi:MAG: glycoside hydrolase family 3 N-terminal domain-containing protein [Imperialibacter sp.]|uniref:glycoside hydrolase family 3 N-terminal domain-containing protein n=1 Tax=Imperialibacter sp. TaxID=2038411 RepID=UPI003A891CF2
MMFKTYLRATFFFSLVFFHFTSTYAQTAIPRPFEQLNEVDKARAWVDSVYSYLTLDEKIGQLLMIAAYSNRDEAHTQELIRLIKERHVGGLVVFQGGPVRQINLINKLQQEAKLPLSIAMDAEWGVGMRLDSTMSFPYQMTLGAIEDVTLIEQMGQAIARQLKRVGTQVNFAPVVDVNNNPNNPVINYRSFGENREEVAKRGVAYVKGLESQGVLASAKHFPGHGDTGTDSHYDLPVVKHDMQRLDSVELYPFRKLIEANVSGIMVAHMSIPTLDDTPNLPTTLSKPVVTDLLKNKLGYKGIIYTDALNMKGVTKYHASGELEKKAFLAGNDALEFSEDVDAAFEYLKAAVTRKEITEQRLAESVKKILMGKYATGMTRWMPVSTEGVFEDLHQPNDELLNRRLFEESVTLLENRNSLLPLKRLDTLKLASLSIGVESLSPFQQRLNDYTEMTHLTLPNEATPEEIGRVKDSLSSYNMVLIGLHSGLRANNREGMSADVQAFLKELVEGKVTVVAAMRNPYTLSKLDWIAEADAVFTTYQEHAIAEDMAAQLIFGGIGAKGRLPVTVNDRWPAGYGLTTEGGGRFKFTLPEELGINSRTLETRIDSAMTLAIEKKAFPGGQVMLAKEGKVFFHKTYGFHTYDSLLEVKKTDIYDLASVTKITAALAAIMKLHDDGKFDLYARLKDYYPYFGWSNKAKLEFIDILTHQAKLKSWIPFYQSAYKKDSSYKRHTLSLTPSADYPIKLTDNLYEYKDYKKTLLKKIKKSKLNPEPGYVYSDMSFYLYPDIVKTLTGTDFQEYLNANFYDRIGGTTLGYNAGRKYSLDRIIPTENDNYFRMTQLHGVVHDEGAAMLDGVSGHAGLFARSYDLAAMWQMYLNEGTYGGERYISPQTIEKFSVCQFCEEGNRRAIGFDKPLIEYNKRSSSVARQASPSSFGHSGYTGTFVWLDPEYDFMYVFLSNRVYPTRNSTAIYDLAVRPTIHTIVYEEMGVR